MKHVMLFIYVFTIPLLVSSMIILVMKGKECLKKGENLYFMVQFLLSLLAATIVDMFTYYSEETLNAYAGDVMWCLNDILFVLIAFTWLHLGVNRGENQICSFTLLASKYYLVAYGLVVAIIYLVDSKNFHIIENLDYGFVALLALGLVGRLFHVKDSNLKAIPLAYSIIGSVVIISSFLGYHIDFSGSTIMYFGNIFLWFLMAIMSLGVILNRFMRVENEEEEEEGEEDGPLLQIDFPRIQRIYNLTNREVEVLKAVYERKSNAEIAKLLYISENTAKTHVHRIFQKLGATKRAEVIKLLEAKGNLKY